MKNATALLLPDNKKAEPPYLKIGSPAFYLRPVAFRPCFTASLALSSF
jgi:hypothetical protein